MLLTLLSAKRFKPVPTAANPPERAGKIFQTKQGTAMLIHRGQREETKGQLTTACLIMFIAFASTAAYGAELLSLIEFKDHGSID